MKAPDFIQEAIPEHRRKALLDAFVEDGSGLWNKTELYKTHANALWLPGALPFGNCPAAGAVYLKRTLDSLTIVRTDPLRRVRVDCRQLAVQCRPALGSGFSIDGFPDARVGPRQSRHSAGERAEVHHRATNEKRYTPGVMDLRYRGGCIPHEVPGGVTVFRLADIKEPMRVAPQGLLVWFGRTDVHPPVDQRGIDADDVDGKRVDQPQRQLGLA